MDREEIEAAVGVEFDERGCGGAAAGRATIREESKNRIIEAHLNGTITMR